MEKSTESSQINPDFTISIEPLQQTSKQINLNLFEWRNIYIFFSFVLRFYFAVQTSYIHPDEHFQSFQPLYNDNLPWEFIDPNNINRSIVPLLIFYYPIVKVGHYLALDTLTIYFLVRLHLAFWSWIIIDWCLYRIMPVKQERMKALFFTATGWANLVMQSHTFSNSLETLILLPVIYLLNDIREHVELQKEKETDKNKNTKKGYHNLKLLMLGTLISLGFFNRVTFIAWIILPGVFLQRLLSLEPFRFSILIISFALISHLIIMVDTKYFLGTSVSMSVYRGIIQNIGHNLPLFLKGEGIVIAPLNNLIYNLDESHLALHGIHSRLTHILCNYPLMVGPLLFFVIPIKNKYMRTTPALSLIGGILILSLVKHQEARFLLPSWPLIATTVTLDEENLEKSREENLTLKDKVKAEEFKSEPQGESNKWIKRVLSFHLIFSLFMSLFYGMVHQAGIIPAMSEINKQVINNSTDTPTIIFWRTYKPPTWMLNFEHFPTDHGLSSCIYIDRDQIESNLVNVEFLLNENKHNAQVIDMMGASFDKVLNIIHLVRAKNSSEIYLITPDNAIIHFDMDSYKKLWGTKWHLDMDHFEFEQFGMDTFKPGLGMYKLL